MYVIIDDVADEIVEGFNKVNYESVYFFYFKSNISSEFERH